MIGELAVAMHVSPRSLEEESPEMLATLLDIHQEQAERMKEARRGL